MIVLRSTYSGTSDEVAALRPAHLEWLDELITGGLVLAAGRLADGTGAAILAAGEDPQMVLRQFDDDPYVKGGVASYEELVTFPAALGGDEIKRLDSVASLDADR